MNQWNAMIISSVHKCYLWGENDSILAASFPFVGIFQRGHQRHGWHSDVCDPGSSSRAQCLVGVECMCCWFPPFSERFSLGSLSCFPPQKKLPLLNFNSIRTMTDVEPLGLDMLSPLVVSVVTYP